jgi:hypothetical protein
VLARVERVRVIRFKTQTIFQPQSRHCIVEEEITYKLDRMRKASNSLQHYSCSREMPGWKGHRGSPLRRLATAGKGEG